MAGKDNGRAEDLSNRAVIEMMGITKVYQMGDVQVNALRGASLRICAGEMVAIMGPSGSGKSTLMNIIGCLDQPTTGTYILAGEDVSRLNDDQLADNQKPASWASCSRISTCCREPARCKT